MKMYFDTDRDLQSLDIDTDLQIQFFAKYRNTCAYTKKIPDL